MYRRIHLALGIVVSLLPYYVAADDLVFLSIGVENYAMAGDREGSPYVRQFTNPPSGNHSGSRVAYSLAQRAKWGLFLQDNPDQYVTREDVWTAVRTTLAKAQAFDDPIVVLYFNGHGLGEGLGNGHFLVPGDFIGPYPFVDLVDSEQQLVHTLGILELLSQSDIPYLAMFDTCYEGKPQRFEDTLAPEIEEFGNSITDILKALNTQYPAVGAAEPMNVAVSIADPDSRLSHNSIGPLARRLLLATAELGPGEIQLSDLIDRLSSSTLDSATNEAVVQPAEFEWLGQLPAIRSPIDFETRTGSGRNANTALLDEVIERSQAEAEEGLATHYSVTEQPMYAKVELLANSFGEGRPASSGKVDDPSDIVFSTALRNAADFSTGDSDVSSFSYDFPRSMLGNMPAQFSLSTMDRWDDQPGIGLSFRGTTCKVAGGNASNVIATVEDGVLQTLAMEFEITCESGVIARGTMDVVW